jgi:hypothetical protein
VVEDADPVEEIVCAVVTEELPDEVEVPVIAVAYPVVVEIPVWLEESSVDDEAPVVEDAEDADPVVETV